MGEVLVLMEGIEKTFPGVHALSQCQFELRAGEVHALVGENGAGKSTLVKVLTGVYTKDAGRIFYKGKEVEIPNPRVAQELGISIIHQELNLMPHLTVAQNIFIGREPRRGIRFLLNEKEINQKTKQLLDMIHLDLDPRTKVADLTVAKQQMVEIAKALSYNSEVLIMDEPTSALSDAETQELFRIIRQLRDKGVGIIYISHRLEELKQISDRVTVMRDGRYIDTVRTQDVTIDKIISMMVGREIYETSRANPENASQEVVLEVKNLNRGRVIKNVSFNLKRGEILGFAGLMGAGRTEVARAIFGADPIDSGEIYVKGKKVDIKSPRDAVKCGIGYLSEDRKRYGLMLGMDVETNIVLATIEKFLGFLGWVNKARVRAEAQSHVDELRIKTPGLQQKVKYLSGGNQQKVVIGKWLARDCEILIFDEPTRGIDVGAKSEIYKLLNDLAESGKSIIMISSELPEILRMSHRIAVMCEGRITGELSASEATQERIMQYATMRENRENDARYSSVSVPDATALGG
ncbi:MAG TPA: sugar ABC transporter ATP-binding protein [Firmicutes bacterium]|nr:sugar ABC transporter ATP-binding protein [Bacillota bacterium]